jgi:uncharacterized glyoxalase superfamily protein PhnB
MSWSVRSAAPVLVVDAVEPSLAFWEDRLGFTRVTDVPHGDGLGFAMLVKESIEVMLQSEASVRDDMGVALQGQIAGTSTVYYIRVGSLDALIATLGDYPIALPRRTTFYGADEIGVYEPGGHLVVFAQPPTGMA